MPCLRVSHLLVDGDLEPTFGIAPKPPRYRPGARLSSCVGKAEGRSAAVLHHAREQRWREAR